MNEFNVKSKPLINAKIKPFVDGDVIVCFKIKNKYFVKAIKFAFLDEWRVISCCKEENSCIEIDDIKNKNLNKGLLVWIDRVPKKGEIIKVTNINANSAQGIIINED